ncbi:uncharacterized protein LOC124539632 isoform X2 [Vanessa cardui]|uniref:uncharacterized protein LOC124539632 isoform X2 n=1 Tax=Vanessa cardui TaxID=171605 RepID=UPI001F1298FD|nr:uncharacterized protein LOC124539632 isoform X2 [Vanessa cardui]
MYLELFLSFILWSNVTLAGDFSKRDIKYLIEVLRRHNRFLDNDKLDAPQSIEELPRAEPIKPGHSLLQPNLDTLKSAARYPQKDVSGTAVYGNLKNLGISYGNSNERVLSTGFRKSNDLLVALLRAIQNTQKNRDKRSSSMASEADNNASEILDDSDSGDIDTRRKHHKKKKKSKFRYRDIGDSTTSDSDSSSRSSDFERNPGNPYTVHKDKYQQNWLWNHFMDGDHMNVNPYAPKFSNAGPSGAALFFGRKWWYYNQDDFKPLK